jgi:hypothetical protein
MRRSCSYADCGLVGANIGCLRVRPAKSKHDAAPEEATCRESAIVHGRLHLIAGQQGSVQLSRGELGDMDDFDGSRLASALPEDVPVVQAGGRGADPA